MTPIIGFAGYSGSGKTTLLEKLIPQLKQHGLRIGLVKHSHHTIDPDTPGKDSYRLRHAPQQFPHKAKGKQSTNKNTSVTALTLVELPSCSHAHIFARN